MKHYPREFIAEAVALYLPRAGVTIAHIADQHGNNRETLSNWIRKDDDQGQGAQEPVQPCGSFIWLRTILEVPRGFRTGTQYNGLVRKRGETWAGQASTHRSSARKRYAW
ncbi:transposase [Nocardiopsis oceani]